MPNGGRIDFQVGFKTDKSSLNQLNKALQDVQDKLSTAQGKVPPGLKQAAAAAKQLQSILNVSWNDKLGQLNLDKVNSGLKKTYGTVQDLNKALSKGGKEGQQAFNSFASEVLNTNLQIKESNALLNDFADTFGKTVKYGIASSIFNNIKNSLQQAFYFAKDLDLSLTNIRIVTGDSADQMERFSRTANQAAKNLGRSTLDYTNAALTFYQQGLGQQDVNARTQATMMAQNITGTGTQMADYLTAVWNGYKVGAEEAVEYVDKLAAVADSSASDMSQLAIAMSKVASAANVMGVDSDQLNAQLATVIATTRQAPESIGTAFKTIYARMNDIKAGTDEAQISLGNYSGKMASLGFNVFDTSGKLRDSGDVIEQVGERWGTLTKEQQVYLAQVMGGTRQYSRLISLFDNWNMYTDMLNVSLNSQGTLLEKNDRYMDSVKAHLEQLNAETERTYQVLSDTGSINAVADAFRGALNIFNDFIQGLGGGLNVFANFGSQFVNLFNQQIGRAIMSQANNLKSFIANLNAVKMKQDIINQVKINAQAQGRDVSSEVALQKQAAIAQKILNVRASLTQEDYNRLTALQQQIGKQQQELVVLESQAEAIAKKTGFMDMDSAEVYKNELVDATSILKTYQQQGTILSQNKNKMKDLRNVQTTLYQMTKDQNISDADSIRLKQLYRKSLREGKLEQSQIAEIIKIQNKYLEAQKGYVADLNKGLQTREQMEAKKAQQQAQESIAQQMIKQAKQQERISLAVKITSGLTSSLTAITGGLTTAMDKTATAAERANGQFSALQGGVSGILSMINPMFGFISQGIFSAIKGVLQFSGAWDKIIEKFETAEEKLERIKKIQQQSSSNSKSFQSSVKEIEGLADEWEKLTKKSGHFTDEEQERYNTIAEVLAKYNSDIIDGYTAEHDAIVSKNDAIKDTIKLVREQYEQRQKALYSDNLSATSVSTQYQDAQDKAEEATSERDALRDSGNQDMPLLYLQETLAKYNVSRNTYTENQSAISSSWILSDEMKNNLSAMLEELSQIDAMSSYHEISFVMEKLKQQQDLLNGYKTEIQDYVKNMAGPFPLDFNFEEEYSNSIGKIFEAFDTLVNDYFSLSTAADEKAAKAVQLASQQFDIDGKTILEGVKYAEQRQGYQEYQQIKESFGDKWYDLAEDIVDNTIYKFSQGLKLEKGGYQTDEEIYSAVQEFEAQLLSILQPDALISSVEKFKKLWEKNSDKSITQYNELVNKTIQDFLKATDTESLLQSTNKTDADKKQALWILLSGAFGLDDNIADDGYFQTKVSKDINKATAEVMKHIVAGFDSNAIEEVKKHFSSLTEDEFYALFYQIQNLEGQSFTTFSGMLEYLDKTAKAAEETKQSLDWSKQLELFEKLQKEKDPSKIQGGIEFLQGLQKTDPILARMATGQGGRYADDYLARARKVAIQARKDELETLKEQFKIQEDIATKWEESGDENYQKVEAYQESVTEMANIRQKIIGIQQYLRVALSETTEELEKQKTVLEKITQQTQSYNKAVDVYNNLLSDRNSEISKEGLESLLELESEYSELAELGAQDRHSREYRSALGDILQLQRDSLLLEKQKTLQIEKQAIARTKERILEQDEKLEQLQASLSSSVLSAEAYAALEAQYNQHVERKKSLQDKESEYTKQLAEDEKEFQLLQLDEVQEKYKNIGDILNGFNGMFDNLLEGESFNEEELFDVLDAIKEKYPELKDEAQKLSKTWMAGTTQYAAALEDVQEKLYSILISEAYTTADQQLKDVLAIDLTVKVDDSEFQQWKSDVQEFFAEDKNVSIAVDNALDEEIRKVKKDFDEIYSAASKIGEGFKVSASDIGEITRVFPQITEGMVRFADGSYELNQQVVQQAIAAAQEEVAANGQAITAKIKQQADYHNAKAAIYDQIATLAGQMAENQVMTEEDKNQRIGQINGLLSQLQEQNKGKVVEYQKKANDEIKVKEQDTATHRQSINANMYRSLTEMSNARAQQDVANTQAMFDADQARANNMRPADYVAGNSLDAFSGRAPIQSSYQVIDPGSTAQDTFTINPDFSTYSTQDWLDLQSQAKARAEQERRLAEVAMSKYYDMLGQANRTIYGLGNVAKGQGIEGAKPEKQKKEKQPAQPSTEKYLQEEFDLYHDINIILSKIDRQLKNIQKDQQKLTGAKLVENYQQQLDLLNQQIAAQKEKIGLAEWEAASLQNVLASQGVAFNSDGTIANYMSALQAKENEVNSFISYYNSLSKEQQEAIKGVLDSVKSEYEDLKKNISKYDNLVNEMIPDLADQIKDELDKKVEINIAKFKMAVDIKINLSQLTRDYNNFVKTIKRQIRQDDILGNTAFAFDDLESYFLDGVANSTTAQANHIKQTIAQIYQINERGMSDIYGQNKAQALKDLEEYRKNLQGDVQHISELINEIRQNVLKAIDQVEDGFKNREKYYNHISDLIDHDRKLVELIFGDKAYQKMDRLYRQQYSYDVKHLNGLYQEKSYWGERLKQEKAYQETLEFGSKAWYQVEARIQKYEEYYFDATSKLNSEFERAIQNIISKYQNGIKEIFSDLSNRFTGGLGFQFISKEWELVKREADMHLDNINKTYQIEKLQSQFQDALAKSKGNIKAQREITALMQNQLPILAKNDTLREHDVERVSKLLELQQKMAALQDARNNKTNLTLRRDSQGNYSYQYSSDADDVASKLQEIRDLKNEIYNLDLDQYQKDIDDWMALWSDWQQELSELSALNTEQREKKQAEINDRYTRMARQLLEDQEQDKVNLGKSTIIAMTKDYDSFMNPETGYLKSIYSGDETNVQTWLTNDKEEINRTLEQIKSRFSQTSTSNYGVADEFFRKLENELYQGNITAFNSMLNNNDNGMVPIWSNGMTQMMEKIAGQGGLEPIAKEAITRIQEKMEEYRTQLEALGEAAKVNTDIIGDGLNQDIALTEELNEKNDMLLRSYQGIFDDMASYWIPMLENFISKHDELKAAIDAITEAYKLQREEYERDIAAMEGMASYGSNGNYNDMLGNTAADFAPVNTGGGYADYGYADYGYYEGGGGGGFGVGSQVRFLSGRYTEDSYGGGASGDASLGSYVTITYTNPGAPRPYHISGSDYWGNYSDLGWVSEDQLGYRSGGYTGNWNSNNGRWALLHQKELVLNAEDTQNMLQAVQLVRDLNNQMYDYKQALLNYQQMQYEMMIDAYRNRNNYLFSDGEQTPIEQNVYISADFSAVRDYREIELAFENLANRASQYLFSSGEY